MHYFTKVRIASQIEEAKKEANASFIMYKSNICELILKVYISSKTNAIIAKTNPPTCGRVRFSLNMKVDIKDKHNTFASTIINDATAILKYLYEKAKHISPQNITAKPITKKIQLSVLIHCFNTISPMVINIPPKIMNCI